MITAVALGIKLGPTIEDLTSTFRWYRTFSEGSSSRRTGSRRAGRVSCPSRIRGAPENGRAPVSVPHEELVAKFKQWAAADGPCPSD